MVAVVLPTEDIWYRIGGAVIVFGELLSRDGSEATIHATDIRPEQFGDYVLDFIRALLAEGIRVKSVPTGSFPHMELCYEGRTVFAELLPGVGINIRFKEL